jgi:hypothetical protein
MARGDIRRQSSASRRSALACQNPPLCTIPPSKISDHIGVPSGHRLDVRLGSISDLAPHLSQVRSSLNSGHAATAAARPFGAKTGSGLLSFDHLIGAGCEAGAPAILID